MAAKDVLRKYNEVSLIKRILVGLVIGVILALLLPVESGNAVADGFSQFFILLGSLFVNALKGVAPVLVFFLVISALCNARAAGSMKTVILLYVISTLVAAIVAVVASYIFPTELTLVMDPDIEQASPSDVGVVLTTLLKNITANPVGALFDANYIGILAWAVVLGMVLLGHVPSPVEVLCCIAILCGTVLASADDWSQLVPGRRASS